MLIKKLGDELLEELSCAAKYLVLVEKMNVVVEPDVHRRLAERGGMPQVYTYTPDQKRRLGDFVDFVVCLGGDGVMLHTAMLFGQNVPPIMAFHLGSLGFLSQHKYGNMCEDLRTMIGGSIEPEACQLPDCESGKGVHVTLRMRLTCEIFRKGKSFVDEQYEVKLPLGKFWIFTLPSSQGELKHQALFCRS